jgi:hypothetical protein
MKHLTAEPALGKLDPKYRPVFARALAKDPADRYPSVSTLLDALRAAFRGEKVAEPPRPNGPIAPPPLPNERRPYEQSDEAYVRYVQAIERVQAYQSVKGEDLKTSLPPMPGTLKAKRRSFSDMLWSMFLAGVLAAALPSLAYGVELSLKGASTDALLYAWVAGITAVLCFGILCLGKIWQAWRTDATGRRIAAGIFGLLVGPAALLLAAYISSPIPSEMAGVVANVGESLHAGRAPEYLWQRYGQYFIQYALLFGFALAIPDWGRATNSTRGSRFSLWTVIWAGSVGLVLASLLANPHGLIAGVVFALVAGIVQWVSPFSTAPRQPRRLARLRKPVQVYA